VPVSTVAPAALVGELELQRVARMNERSPILPAPWSEESRPPAAEAPGKRTPAAAPRGGKPLPNAPPRASR
jgi:TldD protein